MAVLTKGPVGFLLLGLTLLIFLLINRFRNFPPLKYIVLFFTGFLFVISSWLFMEYIQNGMDVLIQFVEYQIDLFRSPVAGHAQPFFYHFVVVFFGCFPISILALPNLFKTKEDVEFDLDKWMRILFWVVIILFSIVTTKIIHYSSMTYLPLSFLAAYTLYHNSLNKELIKKSLRITLLTVGLLIGVGIFAVIFIVVYKSKFDYLFTNEFVKASMSVNPVWYGLEPIIGIVFIAGVIVTVLLLKKMMYLYSAISAAFFTSVTLLLIQLFFIPKLEEHTQGPLIEICEYADQKDAILISYGFKSYAPYYYGNVAPRPSEQKEMQWLMHAKTDQTVLFVSKVNNSDLDKNQEYELILQKGGYKLFKRMCKP
jgi:4-amino-4-deoxy-L-arabinose transferase-like glycosyltransferase